MRTLTWTAVVAAIFAFPLILHKRKRVPTGIRPVSGGRISGEVLRYDIDDLLT